MGRGVCFFVLLTTVGLGLAGCGGGGGSATPTPAKGNGAVTIQWTARTRDVTGPASATSAVISLQSPSLSSTYASMTVARNTAPAAYSATYKMTTPVPLGPYVLTVDFYAQPTGTGGIVATAVGNVVVGANGQLTGPGGGPVNITTNSNITSVSVLPNQSILIGQATTLQVSATDNQGDFFTLTPGSVSFQILSGGGLATLQSNGDLLGIAVGQIAVSATVDGITTQPAFVSVTTPAVTLRTLTLTCNELVQSPTTGLLYASVPSTAPTNGNQVVEINPTTGKITRSLFVGSEPYAMAISDDGSTLYVGLNGAEAYTSIALASGSLQLGPLVTLPSGGMVYDVKVQPGNAKEIAITIGNEQYGGSVGPTIVNNGVFLPNSLGIYQGASMVWPTPSELYAFNNYDTGFDLYQVAVNAQGATIGADFQDRMTGFNTLIRLFGPNIYGTDGSVVSASTGELLGHFATAGQELTVDTAQGHAVIASQTAQATSTTFSVYSTSTFTPVTQFSIPVAGIGIGLFRFGPHGLAFHSGPTVYFVDNAPGF